MPKLFLHIGSNKTATTTLQYRLARSPEVLATAGLLYPATGQSPVGAHHLLAGYLSTRPPEFFRPKSTLDEVLDQLQGEVTASAARSVVISSEMLFWFASIDAVALERLLSLFSEVTVIAYLRRQDSYLPSFYSSLVSRGGCPRQFDGFCAARDLNYLQNLDAWAGCVGAANVIARPFADKYWKDGDVVSDFLAQIDGAPTAEQLSTSESRHQSLSAEAIEVLMATGGGEARTNFRAFSNAIGEHFSASGSTPVKSLMTRPILDSLRQRYDEQNRQLALKYFAEGEAEALRFPPGAGDESEAYEPLRAQAYAELLGFLWESNQAELARSAQKIEQLQQSVKKRREHLLLEQERLARHRRTIDEQNTRVRELELELEGLRKRIKAYESASANPPSEG